VRLLQEFLKKEGYFEGEVTGYFGVVTKKAVQEYQKSLGISPTGFVGPFTRAKLVLELSEVTERFSGKITAVSTACFADGICSVTIDGKTVVITVGRKQGAVGSLLGVESIGDLEQKIGKTAEVYAKKTVDGYTLYGDTNYYVRVQ
jgi:peptidoglycan hydrolase-like protein with peptidoglycan-binding domain